MSQRESGYERKAFDLYETPDWVTGVLVPHLPSRPLGSFIWEPAAGSGQMCQSLVNRMPAAFIYGTDIRDGVDFLKTSEPPIPCEAIITNPPYTHAAEFVAHALRLMEPTGGVVAMLLRSDFAHAKSRQGLFRDCPAFYRKVELLKRITWFKPKPGERGKSPSENHAWFIWDWKNEAAPTLGHGP
jgi:hypothetical protein